MQLYYHSFTKEELLKTIQFKDSNFLFIKNSFPYMLPADVEQYVIVNLCGQAVDQQGRVPSLPH